MGSPVLRWSLLALITLLAACASGPVAKPAVVASAPVEVFYGSNRNLLSSDKPGSRFGQDRGDYEVGRVWVSGTKPLEKSRVQSIEPQPAEEFNARLRAAVQAATEPTVLVFVHGFLRSFGQVARLVGEFVVDTEFEGVPVMWSWPSTSNPTRYSVDETNIDWAMADFARFLENLLAHSGASRVHLVGHSLGGRGLSKVLRYELIPSGVDLSSIGQFVLLAPDIDQDIFRDQYAPVLVDAGLRISLYTSANDKAMASAYAIHGYPRVGDSALGPLVLPGIETIDVSPTNRSFLGHSYFGESEVVARDLGLLLNHEFPAGSRPGMEFVTTDAGGYWRLSPDH